MSSPKKTPDIYQKIEKEDSMPSPKKVPPGIQGSFFGDYMNNIQLDFLKAKKEAGGEYLAGKEDFVQSMGKNMTSFCDDVTLAEFSKRISLTKGKKRKRVSTLVEILESSKENPSLLEVGQNVQDLLAEMVFATQEESKKLVGGVDKLSQIVGEIKSGNWGDNFKKTLPIFDLLLGALSKNDQEDKASDSTELQKGYQKKVADCIYESLDQAFSPKKQCKRGGLLKSKRL